MIRIFDILALDIPTILKPRTYEPKFEQTSTQKYCFCHISEIIKKKKKIMEFNQKPVNVISINNKKNQIQMSARFIINEDTR